MPRPLGGVVYCGGLRLDALEDVQADLDDIAHDGRCAAAAVHNRQLSLVVDRFEDPGIARLVESPPPLGPDHDAPLIPPVVSHHDRICRYVRTFSHQRQG